jgi:hypothetical protein
MRPNEPECAENSPKYAQGPEMRLALKCAKLHPIQIVLLHHLVSPNRTRIEPISHWQMCKPTT